MPSRARNADDARRESGYYHFSFLVAREFHRGVRMTFHCRHYMRARCLEAGKLTCRRRRRRAILTGWGQP